MVSTFMDALTSRDCALSQPSLRAGLQWALRTSTQSLPGEATFHQHPLTPNRGWRVCAPVTDSNSPRQACWAVLRVRELSFTPRSPPLYKNLHLPGSTLGSNRKYAHLSFNMFSLPFCTCPLFSFSRLSCSSYCTNPPHHSGGLLWKAMPRVGALL